MRLPAKALRVCFAQMHRLEEHYIACTQPETEKVYSKVFPEDKAKRQVGLLALTSDPEAAETYEAMQSRSRRNDVKGARNKPIWRAMKQAHWTRGPSMHLFFWLEKEALCSAPVPTTPSVIALPPVIGRLLSIFSLSLDVDLARSRSKVRVWTLATGGGGGGGGGAPRHVLTEASVSS